MRRGLALVVLVAAALALLAGCTRPPNVVGAPYALSSWVEWTPLEVPGAGGISYCRPDKSPSLEGCAVAFLRIKPGAQFPMHGHLAGEQVLLLQGGYVDDLTGVEYGPGDVHVCEPGSSHSYSGVEGPDCICLGVVEGKIDVGGVVLGG